jgi:hypothetical protein
MNVSGRNAIRKTLPWLVSIPLFALATWVLRGGCAPKELPLPKIIRISESAAGRSLQVPVLHYSHERQSTEVDFISAVHIGEKSYYRTLNELFKQYDAVLFEMIADESVGDKLRSHEKRDSSLGAFQRKIADLCGLSFQLDEVDYAASNFVHADLSPDALRAAMNVRGESLPQLFSKILKLSFDPSFTKAVNDSGLSEQGLAGINPLLILLRGPTDSDRRKIKNFMAQGLTASESVLSALEGEQGISLIDDRNAQIISVLRDQLAAKHGRVAIFYGAGHAPDLHIRLKQTLGLKLTKIEWLNAWDLGSAGGHASRSSR